MKANPEIIRKHFELFAKIHPYDSNPYRIIHQGNQYRATNSYVEGYINHIYGQFEAGWRKGEKR